jgi:hypothetical protein
MGIRSSKKRERDKAAAAALRAWYRVRYDDDETYWRRKTKLRYGLPSRIHLELLHDNLWSIVVEPLEGFTHLSNEKGLREAAARGDVYHVSICFDNDIKTEWQQKALAHLHKLYDKPVEHTFQIDRVANGLSVELDKNDSVFKECYWLHKAGKYHYKDLHISM